MSYKSKLILLVVVLLILGVGYFKLGRNVINVAKDTTTVGESEVVLPKATGKVEDVVNSLEQGVELEALVMQTETEDTSLVTDTQMIDEFDQLLNEL